MLKDDVAELASPPIPRHLRLHDAHALRAGDAEAHDRHLVAIRLGELPTLHLVAPAAAAAATAPAASAASAPAALPGSLSELFPHVGV